MTPQDYHQKLLCKRENIFDEESFLSKSVLWQLKTSSLYRWRFAPKEFSGSAAADWGSMVDAELTEPGGVESICEVSPFDSFRTKDAKEWKEEMVSLGKIIVKQDQLDSVKVAASKIRNDRNVKELMGDSSSQVILKSKIADVGVKCMIDVVPDDRPCLVDIKTTSDFSPEGISRKIAQLGYHVQAAWYLKIWNTENPDDQRKRFRFIWQSSEPPYEVAVTELPSFDISMGEEWAAFQLDRLKQSTKKDRWPNIFDDKVALIGRPAWAEAGDGDEIDGYQSAPN